MKITHHKNGEIKTLVDEAPYHPGYEDAGFKPKAVNNKPVAWWDGNPKNAIGISKTKDCDDWFPLYTHPVKELTDEEIYRLLADSIWAVGLNTDCLDEQNWADGITVARAIIRKAQEK